LPKCLSALTSRKKLSREEIKQLQRLINKEVDPMIKLFYIVWKMSIMTSLVIAVVLLARLVLRKAPKAFSYALWAVVLFRALCPFAIESEFALFSSYSEYRPELDLVHEDTHTGNADGSLDPAYYQYSGGSIPFPVKSTTPLWAVGSTIWFTGFVLLQGYNALALLRLRRRLVCSVPLEGEENVRLADHIPSPFVMGLISPKIYLPSDLPETELDYVLIHERTHIRRGDHITRALAWLALTLHWFNPLVWLAFYLAGKDMEMSCDEVVLRKMGRDIRSDYSTSLLRLSVGGKLPSGPLAFGGGDLEGRIKNVLNYKKPALWVPVLALVGVLTMGAALGTDQNRLLIDPGCITSTTSITASSYTLTPENTIVYTPDDLWRDLRDSAESHVLPKESGEKLIGLINSYHKTVFERGELVLNGREHYLVRLDCTDGGFYLVDYWYWNGFNFNPLIAAGEDDYTTLVTHYDAEGNAGTTWQMDYFFDEAMSYWLGHRKCQ